MWCSILYVLTINARRCRLSPVAENLYRQTENSTMIIVVEHIPNSALFVARAHFKGNVLSRVDYGRNHAMARLFDALMYEYGLLA